jgi:putative N6-adenine-specific DNA methylase
VNLHVHGNRATLSLELGGGSMHRRGYRSAGVDAPMMEHVAAAAVRMTGWDGERPLIDPMCGSGTLLAEALLHYCRVPSGYLRADAGLGLEALPDYNETLWREVREQADGAIRALPAGLISGSDVAGGAVAAARENLARLPGAGAVTVRKCRFEDIPAIEGATILCNPPYGLRIGRRDAMPDFMRGFGDFLKQRCTGSTAWIYFGKRELLKSLGLRTSARRPLANGGLDGRLVRVDLY